jgi:hypothetical protein
LVFSEDKVGLTTKKYRLLMVNPWKFQIKSYNMIFSTTNSFQFFCSIGNIIVLSTVDRNSGTKFKVINAQGFSEFVTSSYYLEETIRKNSSDRAYCLQSSGYLVIAKKNMNFEKKADVSFFNLKEFSRADLRKAFNFTIAFTSPDDLHFYFDSNLRTIFVTGPYQSEHKTINSTYRIELKNLSIETQKSNKYNVNLEVFQNNRLKATINQTIESFRKKYKNFITPKVQNSPYKTDLRFRKVRYSLDELFNFDGSFFKVALISNTDTPKIHYEERFNVKPVGFDTVAFSTTHFDTYSKFGPDLVGITVDWESEVTEVYYFKLKNGKLVPMTKKNIEYSCLDAEVFSSLNVTYVAILCEIEQNNREVFIYELVDQKLLLRFFDYFGNGDRLTATGFDEFQGKIDNKNVPLILGIYDSANHKMMINSYFQDERVIQLSPIQKRILNDGKNLVFDISKLTLCLL